MRTSAASDGHLPICLSGVCGCPRYCEIKTPKSKLQSPLYNNGTTILLYSSDDCYIMNQWHNTQCYHYLRHHNVDIAFCFSNWKAIDVIDTIRLVKFILSLSLALKVLGKRHQHTSTVRESVLFIGTQFSILYTSMYSPAEAANTVAAKNKSECPAQGQQCPTLPAPFVMHASIVPNKLSPQGVPQGQMESGGH